METKDTIKPGSHGDLTLVFNLSQDMLCMVDADGNIIKVNRKFTEETGIKGLENLCSSLNDLLTPEDYPSVLNLIKSAKLNSDFSFETRWLCIDNTYKTVNCSAVKNQNEQTFITARLSFVATEKKKQETAAALSEKRFSSLVQSGSDLLAILSADGEYTYVSPTVSHILGYDPTFYIGKNALSFIHPDDREYLVKTFETVTQHYKLELKPYRFIDSNGNWLWLETVITNLLGDPEVKGIVSNSKDITARKQIQDERLRVTGRLNNVLDNFTDGLFIISSDWRITFFNPEAQKMLGIPTEKFLNARYLELFPEAVNLKFYSEYKRAYEENVSVNFQEYYPGLNMWFDVTAYPYEGSLTVFFRNITELKINQTALELEKEVLEMSISSNFSLKETVDYLLKGIEQIYPGMSCLVSELDTDGKKLHLLSAPSMSREYTSAVNGIAIGKQAGSCGTAAYLKEQVIVSDIKTHPYWRLYKDSVLPLGLKSCWSFPVITSSGEVLATFGIYHTSIKEPSDTEIKSIERICTILQLLIESSKNKKEIEISNERYKYTIRATNDIIWDWNLLSKQLYRSEGLDIYFDHKIGFDDSKKWQSNIHPDDWERVVKSLDEIIRHPEKIKWQEDYRYRTNDGSYSFIADRGYVIRDEKKQAIRMVGAMRDISERKKNIEELRNSEKNYKTLFSQNPTPMWTYDLESESFSMANDAALSLFGYTRKEFLLLDLFSIRIKEDHARLKKSIDSSAFYENSTLSAEWNYVKKDGSVITAEVISNFFEINGRKSRLVAIKDITDQKNAELKIIEQNKRLREIAQISSHDFRKPVASILGLVQLFDRENPHSQFNREIIDYLEITANELDEVIHTIVKKTWKEEN